MRKGHFLYFVRRSFVIRRKPQQCNILLETAPDDSSTYIKTLRVGI